MKTKLLIPILVLFAFASCKKDPVLKLNSESVSLTHNKTFQLNVDGSKSQIFKYLSGNEFIAEVDNNGLITGKRVGKTSISVTSNDFIGDCKVDVEPLYETFNEPITTFGLTKAEIKSKEKRPFGSETTAGLLFLGSKSEQYVIYLFDSSGKSTIACVVLSSAFTSELAKYMNERYVIVSTDPVGGVSVDKTFVVTTDLQTNLDWWILYGPVTKSKNITQKQAISEIVNKMKNL